MNFVLNELRELDGRGLLRTLPACDGSILDFSSNDYLGLSGHPRVKEASIKAVKEWGAGSGGSRLMSGNLPVHRQLEQELAELTGMESALLFGSGFLANLGVIGALAGRDDVLFTDRLNHASLVDGAAASRGMVKRYGHLDMTRLEEMLKLETGFRRRFIVTDSVFSMDGDRAPLAELRHLADQYDCVLVVDEAHAIGVFGKGAGLCREAGVTPDILTGTLSKSLGGYGGFAACSSQMRELFINRSRSFIFTTGLPPSAAGAALGALEVLREEPDSGTELLRNAGLFSRLLKDQGISSGSSTQIVPVMTGSAFRAVKLSGDLRAMGIRAVAVRPPTVPENTSRLRFSVTLNHSPGDLIGAASRIGELL